MLLYFYELLSAHKLGKSLLCYYITCYAEFSNRFITSKHSIIPSVMSNNFWKDQIQHYFRDCRKSPFNNTINKYRVSNHKALLENVDPGAFSKAVFLTERTPRGFSTVSQVTLIFQYISKVNISDNTFNF